MGHWIEASLREAVALLAESERHLAANDLRRLLASRDFADLTITRHPDSDRMIDNALSAASLGQLLACLRQLIDVVACRHATIHLLTEARGSTFRTRVLTTYPATWIERYIARRYDRYDPVPANARLRADGFYWSEMNVSDPVSLSFLRDAERHGIGSTGYSQPVEVAQGNRLALSLATTEPSDSFRIRFELFRDDMVFIAEHFVDAFLRLASDQRPPILHLNDAQMLLLRAIASGDDESVLRMRTFDGESYSQLERTICALFRSRTVAQAAVVAAQLGLLEDAPLSRPDVLDASGTGPGTDGPPFPDD